MTRSSFYELRVEYHTHFYNMSNETDLYIRNAILRGKSVTNPTKEIKTLLDKLQKMYEPVVHMDTTSSDYIQVSARQAVQRERYGKTHNMTTNHAKCEEKTYLTKILLRELLIRNKRIRDTESPSKKLRLMHSMDAYITTFMHNEL